MSDHQYHFDVAMSCSGCSNAVNRVLTKLEGVKNIDISLEKQTVDVKTVNGLSYDTVLEKIKKTGKEVKGGSVVA
ncbi:unnamed protein product [[Candida] boidinii]|uniref:Unnamed protein product n=1 Tax=Candida boidinii TaxID=5477 RepID=A0A9W6SVF1_CANBO|nr:hypothetical protein B5S27_g4332 [[Candida] boidinii]OWB68553.1 hypothetical protein B5S30_g3936 [[Candida] boidinii]OWB86156.1 hypothetical protein B5S33_g4838 [[Candida] boidinii]GME67033.1 unnamed protein product [[Candida] boidinii]GMF63764.1 unnamed protein product [[Candida] boidinii]